MSTKDKPGKQRRVKPGQPKRSGTDGGGRTLLPGERTGTDSTRKTPKIGSGWVGPPPIREVG